MNAASVVPGHVVPQGVEGHVRGGQVLRGDSFDIPEKAGACGVESDHPGVNEQLDRVAPAFHPLQDSERVALDRSHRAQNEHRATAGRNGEEFFVFNSSGEPRDREGRRAGSDRQVEPGRDKSATARIGDDDAPHSSVAHGDAGLGQLDPSRIGHSSDGPGSGQRQGADAQPPDDSEFLPTARDPCPEREEPDQGHNPPERVDRLKHGSGGSVGLATKVASSACDGRHGWTAAQHSSGQPWRASEPSTRQSARSTTWGLLRSRRGALAKISLGRWRSALSRKLRAKATA